MTTLKIGILSQKDMRERTLMIARGDYKPRASDPKIWFPSIRSLAEVLSDDNQALLHIITEKKPASISELSKLTGRHSSNLSRTLKTLSFYGFVKLERREKMVYPVVLATQFQVTLAVA